MKEFKKVFFITGEENIWLMRFKFIYLTPVSIGILLHKYYTTGIFDGRAWLEDLKLSWFLISND